MNSIANEERRSKEMVKTRSVLVMVLVLALWSLTRCAGPGGPQEEITRRRRRVSAGEEEGA
jgi:hypothetical protein